MGQVSTVQPAPHVSVMCCRIAVTFLHARRPVTVPLLRPVYYQMMARFTDELKNAKIQGQPAHHTLSTGQSSYFHNGHPTTLSILTTLSQNDVSIVVGIFFAVTGTGVICLVTPTLPSWRLCAALVRYKVCLGCTLGSAVLGCLSDFTRFFSFFLFFFFHWFLDVVSLSTTSARQMRTNPTPFRLHSLPPFCFLSSLSRMLDKERR
ncbi:hypothetical protein BGY98DRAFT_692976 [Russula aff. rugulosa BPL654]|nr:hypothetical protein BGY98DRAFT_692976 [Russula aff. rugulosa BPL654]